MAATPPQVRRSLILDPIHPRDWRELKIIYCCEQCSHFDHGKKACTLGYIAQPHMRESQRRTYEMYGRLAFCRFCEID